MRALVVDRDPAMARELALALASAGVREVYSAGSAEEAAGVINDLGGIDVLIVDVVLGGVDGFTLSESVRAQLPDLRVIFLGDADSSDRVALPESTEVFPRPPEASALAQALLGGGPPSSGADGDPFVGTTFGSYRIDAFLGEDLDGRFYQAFQTTVGRTVEFHTLASDRAADPGEVERFLAAARAKANVHHVALMSVFEAGEQDGIYFYTSELRQGISLWQMANGDFPAPPAATLFQLLHSVAELMVHLGQARVPHEPLHAVHVLLDSRNRPRMVNIATHEAMGNSPVEDMRNLAAAILPIVPQDPAYASLLRLLNEMEIGGPSVRSWTALIYEVKRCAEADVTGVTRAYRLDPEDQAALAQVAATRRRQRLLRRLAVGIPLVLLTAAAGVVTWYVLFKPLGNPALEEMVDVPAGTLVFRDQKVEVPAFRIDRYEVSIGQYVDFLRWAERNPQKVAALSPVQLPPNKSFVPKGWADETGGEVTKPGYFSIARAGGTYEGAPLTLDSPVFGVDSFDAACYAAWKGRRLPTEVEWEIAALGAEPAKAGSVAGDTAKKTGPATTADSGLKWRPVNAAEADRSPSGAVGMAGNVSEWTLGRAEGGGVMPVVRGGNWSETSVDLRRRGVSLEPDQSSPTVGFRTAADSDK